MPILYYSDNLGVMREHLKDASVDFIYLDPLFNSKRDYNVLFKSPKGDATAAGFYSYADRGERKVPRMPILTIEDLLSGWALAKHPDQQPYLNFKKAKLEVKKEQGKLF